MVGGGNCHKEARSAGTAKNQILILSDSGQNREGKSPCHFRKNRSAVFLGAYFSRIQGKFWSFGSPMAAPTYFAVRNRGSESK
jgi:hypothetical protein